MKARPIVCLGLGALMLTPLAVWAWGTASSPAEMTGQEDTDVRTVMGITGISDDEAFWADFTARRDGPHVIHQFIAWQACELLKKDPAYKGSGFPPIEEINRWDGQFRVSEGTMGYPAGPVERRSKRREGELNHPQLTPEVYKETSPGPDADASRDMEWNPFYNGRAHYWNPWLQTGGAPDETGGLYVELVNAIVQE